MASRNYTDESYALEPAIYNLFAKFTGGGQVATLKLDVDGGTEEFTVGDVVTGGTSNAFGIVYAIQSSTGVWDVTTHTGAATLVLIDVTGTFQNAETVTGALSGSAAANGTGTAGTLEYDPTNVKGKGITSIVSDTIIDGSPGLLVITLDDLWAGLLSFSECVITSDTADDWEVTVVSETVATAKQITIQVFKGGAATHPEATETICLEFVLAPYPNGKPAGF